MEVDQDRQGIDSLKQVLIQTLENQGALNAIKADVRATVFGALNTQLDQNTRLTQRKTNSKIEQLLRTEDGTKAFEYVIDLLKWTGLKHTLKVIEAELPTQGSEKLKSALQKKESSGEEPLLVRALKDQTSVAPSSTEKMSPKNKLPQISVSPQMKRTFSPIPIVDPSPGKQIDAGAGMNNQPSTASLYSEITEEIEEVMSFVEEGSDQDTGFGLEMDGEKSELHPMDSTTLDVVNSTLSASDHSGEIDSDADEIVEADF